MELKEYFRANLGAQIRLARKLNVSQAYLSLIANGHRQPSPEIALDIFIELGGRVNLKSINATLSHQFQRLCEAGLIQYLF